MSVVIPYGTTWRSLEIPLNDAAPAGWLTAGFDDSGWANSPAPFGVASVSGCAIHSTNPPATLWSSNTARLYRLSATFGGTVRFRGPIDNEIAVWVDGIEILAQTAGSTRAFACAHRDDWVAITSVGNGSHLVAVRTWDFGLETYFDLIAETISGWGVGQIRMT